MPVSRRDAPTAEYYDALDSLQSTMSKAKDIGIQSQLDLGLLNIEQSEKQDLYKYGQDFLEMGGKAAEYKIGEMEASKDADLIGQTSYLSSKEYKEAKEKTDWSDLSPEDREKWIPQRDYGGYTEDTMWGRYKRTAEDFGVMMGDIDPLYKTESGVSMPRSMMTNLAALNRAMVAYPGKTDFASFIEGGGIEGVQEDSKKEISEQLSGGKISSWYQDQMNKLKGTKESFTEKTTELQRVVEAKMAGYEAVESGPTTTYMGAQDYPTGDYISEDIDSKNIAKIEGVASTQPEINQAMQEAAKRIDAIKRESDREKYGRSGYDVDDTLRTEETDDYDWRAGKSDEELKYIESTKQPFLSTFNYLNSLWSDWSGDEFK